MIFVFAAASVFPEIDESFGKIGLTFWQANWQWFAIGAVVAVAAFVAGFYLRPKPKQPTPYQKAMQKLGKLGETELEDEPFANELSAIVREFIEAQYNLPAPERTTQEFLKIASASEKISPKVRDKLAQLLQAFDMAKFAKGSFSNSEKSEVLTSANEFVEMSNIPDKKEDSDKNEDSKK